MLTLILLLDSISNSCLSSLKIHYVLNYRPYKRVAERANILLTWTEARGRSSFFRKHLPPIKLRVVIRFYPQSIPLTAVRIKRQAEMKTVFVIFAALMVCYAITLVER